MANSPTIPEAVDMIAEDVARPAVPEPGPFLGTRWVTPPPRVRRPATLTQIVGQLDDWIASLSEDEPTIAGGIERQLRGTLDLIEHALRRERQEIARMILETELIETRGSLAQAVMDRNRK